MASERKKVVFCPDGCFARPNEHNVEPLDMTCLHGYELIPWPAALHEGDDRADELWLNGEGWDESYACGPQDGCDSEVCPCRTAFSNSRKVGS